MSTTIEPVQIVPPSDVVQPEGEPTVSTGGATRSRARRRVVTALVACSAFLLGFVVFLFVASPLVEARHQVVLADELRTLSTDGPASVTTWRPTPGEPIGVISIPRIGVQTVVVEGTTAYQLMSGPGHFAVSPMPGGPGNVVVMGRRSTFGGPFGSISLLHKGDSITISTGVGAFTYTVHRIEVVPAGALDVIGPTSDNRLTLVTAESGVAPDGRVAVTAMLNGDPADLAPASTNVTTNAETGLAGDPRGIGGVLLWGELLIAAVVLSLWARRRVPPRVVWLLGAPIVAALTWATYLALAQVLPSTL